MSAVEWILVEGQKCLALETVAAVYAVERRWLVTVIEYGLLGECREVGGAPAIPVERLDRLARIKQLNVHLRVELESVSIWLGPAL